MTATRAGGPLVGVALKWAPLRVEVDPLSGTVDVDPRFAGASAADKAALEWALRLAEAWGGQVVAVSAGPAESEGLLRQALAAGAAAAVRCPLEPEAPSERVAAALAGPLAGAAVVVCGDASADRGSGAVPAFLAAELGAAQALGLVTLEMEATGVVRAERRLDGGRRERLRVRAPAVLSVEGAAARLRRAPLPSVLRARTTTMTEVSPPPAARAPWPARRSPYRPRPKAVPRPDSRLPARARTLALTGALEERTPPRTVTADPEEAAKLILDQLRAWGYTWGTDDSAE